MTFSVSLLPPPRSCTIEVNGEALRKNTEKRLHPDRSHQEKPCEPHKSASTHTKPCFTTGYIYLKRSFPPSPAVFNTHSSGSMGAV
jgi:hypothetical protein